MKILAVVGSPRKGGNTDLLMDALVRGAREAGATVERVFLADRMIAPCDGCDGCRKAEMCVIDDDMIPLYDELFESDVWVLGTPIYWWGPSAQLKAFIDRWYLFGDALASRVKGKRAALVAAFGDSDPAVAHHTAGMLADAFEYLEMDFADQLLVSADARGEVLRNQAALQQAHDLGRKLAQGQ